MSFLSSEILFKSAAALYAVGVPGHIFMGFDKVYPALNSAPKNAKHAVGLRGAENCWNYVAAGLGIACRNKTDVLVQYAAMLNWQYSRTGGPVTLEEVGVFWTVVGIHVVNGIRYAQVEAYETLLFMWVAPVLSVVAWYKS